VGTRFVSREGKLQACVLLAFLQESTLPNLENQYVGKINFAFAKQPLQNSAHALTACSQRTVPGSTNISQEG
jgi:hypothetical protein